MFLEKRFNGQGSLAAQIGSDIPRLLATLLLGLGILSVPALAHADDHGRNGGRGNGHDRGYHRGFERHEYRERPHVVYRHINDRNWERGRWMHGMRNGQLGWWWVVGYNWFYYPQPVYPYPINPYAPQVVYAPPVVVAPPAPTSGINLIIPFHIH